MVKIEIEGFELLPVDSDNRWGLTPEAEDFIRTFHIRRRRYRYIEVDIDKEGYIIPSTCPPEPADKEWTRLP